MDILANASNFYTEFMKYEFIFIFGDKRRKQHIINIAAKSEHFPHVVGLDKLKDIKGSIYKNHNKDQIIKGIENEEITISQLEKSSHYTHEELEHSVEKRIEFLPFLMPIINFGLNQGRSYI